MPAFNNLFKEVLGLFGNLSFIEKIIYFVFCLWIKKDTLSVPYVCLGIYKRLVFLGIKAQNINRMLCYLIIFVNSQSKFHSGNPVAITLKNQWI